MPRQKNSQPGRRRWSQRVTERSDALDLEPHVFSQSNPRAIASSLRRSALRSHRRKADPFRSALSMLTFYINRAGRKLSSAQRQRLEKAKLELRTLFHKPISARAARRTRGRTTARRAATAR